MPELVARQMTLGDVPPDRVGMDALASASLANRDQLSVNGSGGRSDWDFRAMTGDLLLDRLRTCSVDDRSPGRSKLYTAVSV